jgi:N-acetylneuraminic acid mutarotase
MNKNFYCVLILFALTLNAYADYWTQKADLPWIQGKADCCGFAIGTKGYIGTGFDPVAVYTKDWYEYDPATNSWLQKADYGGQPSVENSSFTIGGFGYLLPAPLGLDFWQFDPVNNVWTQKANFAGPERQAAVAWSIDGKGYITTGALPTLGGSMDDLWEYDPSTNMWTQKASLPGTARHYAAGFAVNGKGYVGTGYSSVTMSSLSDFWEWDPVTNVWTQKTSFPGGAIYEGTGFNIGNTGYMGTGYGTLPQSDIWKYDPLTDTWTAIADFGGGDRVENVSFGIGNFGYLGTGWDGVNFRYDFWEYHPEDSTTGVNEFEAAGLKFEVSPNPATDYIVISSITENSTIVIRDAAGREVYTKQFSANTLNFRLQTSNFSKGIYYVELSDGNDRAVQKFLKE